MAAVGSSRAKPTLLAFGVIAVFAGCALLTALGVIVYGRPWSDLLISAGIPTALLVELAGLTALFGGGALIAALVAARRRNRH